MTYEIFKKDFFIVCVEGNNQCVIIQDKMSIVVPFSKFIIDGVNQEAIQLIRYLHAFEIKFSSPFAIKNETVLEIQMQKKNRIILYESYCNLNKL